MNVLQVQRPCVHKTQVRSVDTGSSAAVTLYNLCSSYNCVYNNLVYAQHCADGLGVSTVPGPSNSQSSSSTGLVAGVAVSMVVLVLAAVCIVVLVVWLR